MYALKLIASIAIMPLLLAGQSFFATLNIAPPNTSNVCVDAYWDGDNDGKKDNSEKSIGGVPILLKFDKTILVRRETNNEAITCIDVEPGTYTIELVSEAPIIITWTTRNIWTFTIDASSTVNIEFGVASIAASETATVNPNSEPTDVQSAEGSKFRRIGQLLSLAFQIFLIALIVLATPVGVIALMFNYRILKAIRQIQSDIHKEPHV